MHLQCRVTIQRLNSLPSRLLAARKPSLRQVRHLRASRHDSNIPIGPTILTDTRVSSRQCASATVSVSDTTLSAMSTSSTNPCFKAVELADGKIAFETYRCGPLDEAQTSFTSLAAGSTYVFDGRHALSQALYLRYQPYLRDVPGPVLASFTDLWRLLQLLGNGRCRLWTASMAEAKQASSRASSVPSQAEISDLV